MAKKEIELAELNKSLVSSYSKLRTYAVRDFYIQAMPECGGLFVSRQLREEAAKRTRAEILFALDVPTCLKGVVGKVDALRDLTPRDRQTFDDALARISQEIADKRQQLLREYESTASRVTDADWASLPGDSFRVRGQILREEMRGGAPDLRGRREIAEAIAKERVATAYEDFIRDRVVSLRNVKCVAS